MAESGSIQAYILPKVTVTFSWNLVSQSVEDNTSTINWTYKEHAYSGGAISTAGLRNYTILLGNNSFGDNEGITGQADINIDDNQTRVLASGTKTFQHDLNGNRSFYISFTQDIYIYYQGTTREKATNATNFSLPNIPKGASILSAPNFSDEDNPTITYSNPTGSNATTLQASICWMNDTVIAQRDIPKTGSTYTFELTWNERYAIWDGMSSRKTRSVIFRINSTVNGSDYESTLTRTVDIVNATPTLNASAIDTNGTSVALTGDNTKIIKGYNNVFASMTNSAYKGASIVSKSITCGSSVVSADSTNFQNVDIATVTFSVTDSRGVVVTRTVDNTLIPYVQLTCNLDATLPDYDGTSTLDIRGNYFKGSFGSQSNSLTVYYRHSVGDGAFSDWISIPVTFNNQDNTYSLTVTVEGLDYQQYHTFQAKAVDKLHNIESAIKQVRTFPVFDWGENDFNFNVPITMYGQPIDYIVEQGSNGIWTYRKWSSGIAECWGQIQVSKVVATNQSWMYTSGGIAETVINFPFEFISTPTVTAFISDSSATGYLSTVENSNNPTTNTHTGILQIVSGKFTQTATDYTINYNVKGNWK